MVGARIPPELHSQLLEAASRLQVTPSEVIVAALRQYLERLQTPVNSPTVAGILDRLEQLERRVEALEAARPRRVFASALRSDSVAEQQQAPAPPPSDLDALPVMELRRLARQVIGPGGDRDPSSGKHLRRAELLTALQRMLGKDQPVSGMGSMSLAEGSLESNPAKPPEYSR
jgi:hypothetical protein